MELRIGVHQSLDAVVQRNNPVLIGAQTAERKHTDWTSVHVDAFMTRPVLNSLLTRLRSLAVGYLDYSRRPRYLTARALVMSW